MPEESIENISKSDSNLARNIVDHHFLPDMSFNGHCVIKNIIFITKKSNKSIYFLRIMYTIRKLNKDFMLVNCLANQICKTN